MLDIGGVRMQEIIAFQQSDERWNTYPYAYADIQQSIPTNLERSGCGILAYVNAIYALNGQFIEPTFLADYALSYGHRVCGVGTAHSLYPSFAKTYGKQFGFEYVGATVRYQKLRKHLLNGGSAVGSTKGHLMAIVAYENGLYLILDSSSSESRDTFPDGITRKSERELKQNEKLHFKKFFLFHKR